MMTIPPCPCGKSWDVIADYSDAAQTEIEATIVRFGELVPVHVGARSWMVSRRCIAYHGITGLQLLSGKSGFEEITPVGSGRGRGW